MSIEKNQAIDLGPLSGLPDGQPVDRDVETTVGPRSLIVFRQGSAVRCWLNVCPHQGRPLNLGPDRFLTDEHGRLVCAAHGAVFRLSDGLCEGGPCQGASLHPVSTELRDGRVTALLQTC